MAGSLGKGAMEKKGGVAWEEGGMDKQHIWIPGALGSLGLNFPMSNMNQFRRLRRSLPAPTTADLEQLQPCNSSDISMT